MKCSCPSCGVKFVINPEIIPEGGQKARCPKCRVKFIIRKTAKSSIDVHPGTAGPEITPLMGPDHPLEKEGPKLRMADTLTMTLTGLNVLKDSEPIIRKALREELAPIDPAKIKDDQAVSEAAMAIYQNMPLPLRIMVADSVFLEYCLENRYRLTMDDKGSQAKLKDAAPTWSGRFTCPNCGAVSVDREECVECGIIFSKCKSLEKEEENREPILDQAAAQAVSAFLHPGEKILTVIPDVYGQPLILTNTGLITDKAKGRREIENCDFGRFYFFDILHIDANPHLLGLVFEIEAPDRVKTKFIIAEEKALRLFYDVLFPTLQRFLAHLHTRGDKRNDRLLADLMNRADDPLDNGSAAGSNQG